MIYEIENEYMKVAVDTLGAQLQSVFRKDGNIEHLWQGDPKYWKSRSPNLFPIVGRLFDGQYSHCGRNYSLKPHGFARNLEFTLVEKSSDKMVFALSTNQTTAEIYPFDFIFKVGYSLDGRNLVVLYTVENVGKEVMYFGLGAHPGFNVPFDGGEFEDYYIETARECEPKQALLSPSYLMSGETRDYPLEGKRILPLTHELFDNDAVILTGCGDCLSIKSRKTDKFVTVSFPKMNYVGLWQAVKSDAPFVCIEPWKTLPSLDGKVEALSDKENIGELLPGETYQNPVTITLG